MERSRPSSIGHNDTDFFSNIFCVKLNINNHIVRLVHKKHIIRTCLMYHHSLQSWVSTVQTVVLTDDVFQLLIKYIVFYILRYISQHANRCRKLHRQHNIHAWQHVWAVHNHPYMSVRVRSFRSVTSPPFLNYLCCCSFPLRTRSEARDIIILACCRRSVPLWTRGLEPDGITSIFHEQKKTSRHLDGKTWHSFFTSL